LDIVQGRRDHSGASPSDFRGDVTLTRRTAVRRQQPRGRGSKGVLWLGRTDSGRLKM
jgi:hypothetical protein